MNRFTADCWFLTGPTASGKSKIAMALAERLDVEIIAMDSMTLYRGLDIGAAKPTVEDRRQVPHHVIDVLDPSESASVHLYLRLAEEACTEIRARGRTPLFVGGTPLYLKSALRGLFEGPGADHAFRQQLEIEAKSLGTPALHERLQSLDPASAQRILPGDLRRIIRALEIHHLTGRPISEWQQEFGRPANPAPKVACLSLDREELYRRINQRTISMLEGGWIEETRELLDRDQSLSRQALQAVGYKEIIDHLNGELDFATLVERIQTRTRQFSKRQRTWFRHLEECTFFELSPNDTTPDVVDSIADYFQRQTGE